MGRLVNCFFEDFGNTEQKNIIYQFYHLEKKMIEMGQGGLFLCHFIFAIVNLPALPLVVSCFDFEIN